MGANTRLRLRNRTRRLGTCAVRAEKNFDTKEYGWPVSRQPAMRHHCVNHASVTFNFKSVRTERGEP